MNRQKLLQTWQWACRQTQPFELDDAAVALGLSKSNVYVHMQALLGKRLAVRTPRKELRGPKLTLVYHWQAAGDQAKFDAAFPVVESGFVRMPPTSAASVWDFAARA